MFPNISAKFWRISSLVGGTAQVVADAARRRRVDLAGAFACLSARARAEAAPFSRKLLHDARDAGRPGGKPNRRGAFSRVRWARCL